MTKTAAKGFDVRSADCKPNGLKFSVPDTGREFAAEPHTH